MVMRPRAKTKKAPSGRTALIVNTAPDCLASKAVCVCDRLNTGHSGVCSKKLGVVIAAPSAVFSVEENCQSVKSTSGEVAPCSRA